MKQTLTLIGAFLFRNRGVLGIPIFLVALFLGKPNWYTLLAGSLVLAIGESMRVFSVAYAGAATRSTELNARILVTSGPYAYVRNPIYLGNFFIGLGGIVILSGWLWWYIAIFIVLFWIYYGLIVLAEEDFLHKEFGMSYEAYKDKVRRFIPRLKPYRLGQHVVPDYSMSIRSERSTLLVLILILVVGAVKVILI